MKMTKRPVLYKVPKFRDRCITGHKCVNQHLNSATPVVLHNTAVPVVVTMFATDTKLKLMYQTDSDANLLSSSPKT